MGPQTGGGRLETATRPWLRGVLRCGLLLAAASLAVLPMAGTASAAPATPSGGGVQSLTPTQIETLQPYLDRLHATYELSEAATQKYDALSEQLNQANADDAQMQVQVDNAQASVDAGTVVAGQLAAAQYRNGDLSQLGQLIFAKDPQQALHTGELLKAAGTSQAAFLKQLQTDQQSLLQAKTASATAKTNAASLLAAQALARNAINKQLDSARLQVSTLTGAQQSLLSSLEQLDANAAQAKLLASGALGQGGLTPSQAGAAAVAYAFDQIGSPYIWGGTGPYRSGFDCSGLTSQAWAHAGVPIPRTSEEQWAQLPHVPLDALRPGDLIVYFSGASHIAIYIGGGQVIEAPHPGANVYVAPIATDPILGAVRPDPNSPSVGSYTPPPIPKGGSKPQPVGPGPAPQPSPTHTSTPAPPTKPPVKPVPKPPKPSGGTPPPVGKPTPAPTTPTAAPTPTADATPTAGDSTTAASRSATAGHSSAAGSSTAGSPAAGTTPTAG